MKRRLNPPFPAQAAIELVSCLSNDTLVKAKVDELRGFGDKIAAGTASPDEIAAIPLAAMALGVLAMVPANVPRLAANDAATPMVRLMGAVAAMKDFPHVDELLATFGGALVELEAADDRGAFPDDEALAAAVLVVKNHTTALAAVVPALKLIKAICGRNTAARLRSGSTSRTGIGATYLS